MENKRLKRDGLRRGKEETQAFHSARAPSQSEAAARCTEPTGGSPTPSRSSASPRDGLEVTGRGPRGGRRRWPLPMGPHPWLPFLPQDSLWLQEVSNLSEWLNPGPEP